LSQQTLFFEARAAEEQEKAKTSTLVNVRDGHLRAASVWMDLATRSSRSDRLREEEDRRKAEEKERARAN
jgi:hypothetical protein